MKLFLSVFAVWSITLCMAWVFAPESAAYSSYWTWVFWIWFVLAVGIIRGAIAFHSGSSSEDVDYDSEDDDISPSLLASDQLDITKNF
ncbi:hypothetical protein [Marinobacter sp.]|uniref:hypothetical protein n=1 Tax=Marinobacter sp. TaxID=50741 RepID=UPI00356635D0